MARPQIGDINCRGYILPDTCGCGDIEALPSIYGAQPVGKPSGLLFYIGDRTAKPPADTEVLFDVIASPWNTSGPTSPTEVAANVRRA